MNGILSKKCSGKKWKKVEKCGKTEQKPVTYIQAYK